MEGDTSCPENRCVRAALRGQLLLLLLLLLLLVVVVAGNETHDREESCWPPLHRGNTLITYPLLR
jgi:hypothetical protein